jgi:hypothetical protein
MADQSDVESALLAIVANALYPNGVAAASALDNVCRVYRGYPYAPNLTPDLAAGILHVSINATGGGKNVTRYSRKWQILSAASPTLTVVSGLQTASFFGVCAVGQLAGVSVNGAIFPYAVQASDTPATVASNLCALLRATGWLVDYAATTITVPNASSFSARVVTGANALQEIKRQDQDFRIEMWCPSPSLRDTAGSFVDEALASVQFLPLSDGSSARLIYVGSSNEDGSATASLYKRTITFSAEYPTTLAQFEPAMLFGVGSFDANAEFVESLHG